MRCPNFASGRISSRDYGWIPLGWSGSGSLTWDHLDQGRSVDLLQVDLLASDEVARARLVSLDGFPFAFRVKNGEWRDLHLGFQVSFASPWLQWQNVLIPLPLNLLNVCVCISIIEGANLFTLCESWRAQGAGKKQNLVWISSQYWERRFHNQGILDIHTHF